MTRNTITLPRSVVEQALKVLNASMPHNNDMDEDWPSHIAARRALRAALEQQDHCEQHLDMVPADWKLVPVEPTKDMKAAGAFAAMDQVRRSYNPPSAYIPVDSMALLSYRAMIAAAPQPQVEQEPVAVVTGFYGGFPTIRPLEPATVLPAGMALYANPQPPRQPLTKEEIAVIKLAREAGFSFNDGIVIGGVSDLERFAALVAAAEREACAQLCDIRETMFKGYKTDGLAALCAAAIRARGQQ